MNVQLSLIDFQKNAPAFVKKKCFIFTNDIVLVYAAKGNENMKKYSYLNSAYLNSRIKRFKNIKLWTIFLYYKKCIEKAQKEWMGKNDDFWAGFLGGFEGGIIKKILSNGTLLFSHLYSNHSVSKFTRGLIH